MGEVRGQWPSFQADRTLARGPEGAPGAQRVAGTTQTRGELNDQIAKLSSQVESLSTQLDAERSRPAVDGLLDQHRFEVDQQIEGLAADVKSCLAALANLESDIGGRFERAAQLLSTDDYEEELRRVERGIRAEVVKLHAEHSQVLDQVGELVSAQGALGEQVIDLRTSQDVVSEQVIDLRTSQDVLGEHVDVLASSHSSLGEQQGTTAHDQQLLRSEIAQETTNLRETIQAIRTELSGQVAELHERQEHVVAHVVDLRSLQGELSSRQMATIVDNGRLREELVHEAAQLRAMVEESRETAEKAMFRASTAANNHDAFQAEVDRNVEVAERRLQILESLIQQVDLRVSDSQKQVAQLAAHAVTGDGATHNVTIVEEHLVTVHTSVERLDEKLAEVEAHRRLGATEAESVADRLRILEGRLDQSANDDDGRDELLREAAQLRNMVESSRATASQAMSHASTAAEGHEAIQAQLSQTAELNERRIEVLESLIRQVDVRVSESHEQLSELASQAVNDANAAQQAIGDIHEAQASSEGTSVAGEELLIVHGSVDRLDEKLAQVEAVSDEHRRRRALESEVFGDRLRSLEHRLAQFEQQFPDEDHEDAGDNASEGWQFERRKRRMYNF